MLAAIAIAAGIGERSSRERRWGRVVMAVAVVVATWGLVVQQASALTEDPQTAHAIELGAPLGRIGMALARRATDRDHDGSSPYFGGGDCDDRDARRSPDAIDVPGNGIDEDCSGGDLKLPRPAAAPTATAASIRPTVPHDLNLVLITVDTLRIDLGFMGYPKPVSPNLDKLAARSTVFERAYSMASYTGKSVGPTMIGKYPSETFRDGAHFDTYFPENTFLAERLQNAGFHTMGVASHWYFKPKFGLAQGMDVWDMSAMPPDSNADVDSSVTSDSLANAAIRLLADPANVQGRFFMWVHFFDPHANYVAHPEAPDFRAGAKIWSKPLYDGEVWFTDHHMGRLFDFIASQPWGARTAIVITADHGEAFDEHGMNWHGVDLWEPLVRVPLVVYVPGVKPHRVKARRSLIDLVPTVLDLMGIPQPPAGELSGESTVGAILSPDDVAVDERDVYMDMPAGPQVSQHRALIHGPTPGMKLMHPSGRIYLVFDLSKDPGEVNDLGRDRGLLSRMMEAYDDKLATLREIHVDPAPYEAASR
jgi:arylsulfatase A-like enzyme